MAIIRIKRSTGVVGPSSLSVGELAVTIEQATQGAWNNEAGRLYVGNAAGVPVQIGGEYYTEILNHEPSIITDSSAVIVGSSGTVSNWNVVGISTFGDVNVSGGSTFSKNVTIGGTISATVGIFTDLTVNNSLAVGNVSIGSSLLVSSPATATRLDITEDLTVGAGATITGNVSIASSLTVGTGNSEFYVLDTGNVYGQSLTLAGLNTTTLVYIGTDFSLRNPLGLSYAESPNILTVDGTVAISSVYASVGVVTDLTGNTLLYTSGNVTSLTVGNAGTQYSLPSGAGTTGQILKMGAGGGTEFATLDFRLNYQSDNLAGSVGLGSETWDILGTANQIKTDAPGIGRTITIGLTNDVTVGGALTVSGDLTLGGSLEVQGNLTYLNSVITQIEDKLIELAVTESPIAPSDSSADGGGISIKGNTDYQIVWSNSVGGFTVNQNWYPLNSDQFDLGSELQQWRQIFVQGTSELTNTNIAGIVTAQQVEILAGSINNTTIGAATSNTAAVTSFSYTSATGGDLTATTIDGTDVNISNLRVSGVTTVGGLFVTTNPALNSVAYAGTSGIVGFTSAPNTGISTSTYILTSVGGVPVFTDTIDCGTY